MTQDAATGGFDVTLLEYGVLGAMIRFPDRAYEMLTVRDSYFTNPTIRKAFLALRTLYEEEGSDGLQSTSLMRSRLCTLTDIDDRTAFGLISDGLDQAPESPGAIPALVEELTAHGLRRAIKDAAVELRSISERTGAPEDIAYKAMAVVGDAVKSAMHTRSKSLSEELQAEIEIMERIERGDYHERPGMSTGLNALDSIIGGFHNGEMIIVAARPSIGKSSLANRFAWSLAVEQGKPGLIISAEMKANEWIQRILCSTAKCDLQKARQRLLNPNERQRYMEVGKSIKDVEWYIEDDGGISTPRLLAATTRMHHEHGIQWVILDYLQRVDHMQRHGESHNAAIERTSNAMKDLALSLDIPAICLSQLNRDCEKRDNKRPRLSDLRDSGSLEQDADVVMMLYRDRWYWDEKKIQEEGDSDEEIAEIIVAKQRNGPTGTAKVGFNRSYASFHNVGGIQLEDPHYGPDPYVDDERPYVQEPPFSVDMG